MTQDAKRPTRRQFLAAAPLPLAAAPLAVAGVVAPDRAGCDLIRAARAYARLVPAWTEAARALAAAPSCVEARRRFDEADTPYDSAKRDLIARMRARGRQVVVDREQGRLYLDCNPAGSHEDIHREWNGRAVVRVLPLADLDGLA